MEQWRTADLGTTIDKLDELNFFDFQQYTD